MVNVMMRWMVRREPRPTKFGDRVEVDWAVTPYLGRYWDGTLVAASTPTRFASLPAAIAYARSEMRRHYRSNR